MPIVKQYSGQTPGGTTTTLYTCPTGRMAKIVISPLISYFYHRYIEVYLSIKINDENAISYASSTAYKTKPISASESGEIKEIILQTGQTMSLYSEHSTSYFVYSFTVFEENI